MWEDGYRNIVNIDVRPLDINEDPSPFSLFRSIRRSLSNKCERVMLSRDQIWNVRTAPDLWYTLIPYP